MSKRLKFVLLLLLSLTSVFFAEVISGSTKFPLYDAWSWIVITPLYGLHTIILLYIIMKYTGNNKVLFSTLYFAGVIFGLYEAYLTKVLWVGLMDDTIIILNISIMETIVLIFLWHPILSFIIPAIVFEAFMTNSNTLFEGLPQKFKKLIKNKKTRVILFLTLGAFLSFNSLGPVETLLSGFTTVLPIILLYYLLRKKGIHKKYSFEEILPTKSQFIIYVFLLSVMYIVLGLFIEPEALTLNNQLSIWILYLVFGIIFYLKLRKNKSEDDILPEKVYINLKEMLTHTIVIVASGTIFATIFWLLGIQLIFMVIAWIFWMFLGMYLLVYSLLS